MQVEGLQSVGGCISYLRHLLLDADVIPAATFSKITSLNQSTLHMVLDSESPLPRFSGTLCVRGREGDAIELCRTGTTLCNLSILENDMGTKEGTLLKYLDNCSTAFGPCSSCLFFVDLSSRTASPPQLDLPPGPE